VKAPKGKVGHTPATAAGMDSEAAPIPLNSSSDCNAHATLGLGVGSNICSVSNITSRGDRCQKH
jgi:hypothetical protein